jgi:hypothetical protein
MGFTMVLAFAFGEAVASIGPHDSTVLRIRTVRGFRSSGNVASRNRSQQIHATNVISVYRILDRVPAQPHPDPLTPYAGGGV